MDVLPASAWWLLLALSSSAYLLLSAARVAFRLAGPVTLEALVDRVGEERTEFLRKSLRSPTALWFALSLANGFALLGFVVVLVSGHRRIPPGWGFELFPTGRPLHDLAFFVLLAVLLLSTEFLLPVGLARTDKTVLIRRMLPVIRFVHVTLSPVSNVLERWSGGGELEEPPEEQPGDEQVEAFITVGQREGILEESEGELLRNIVLFGDTRVHEVMTPRTDVVGISRHATVRDLLDLLASTRFSRVPVHEGSIDAIVGIASSKDALAELHENRSGAPISQIMTAPFIVPESKPVHELLREMQARRQQVAIVADEYGGTAGLVTIEDLLEELVGEIREEHEEGDDVVAVPDGTWLVRGRAALHDVGEAVGASLETEDGPATIAGLLLSRCDRVPAPGEVVEHEGFRFTIEEADRRRVHLVRIARAVTDSDAVREAEAS